MPLLAVPALILGKPSIDDLGEPIQLGSFDLGRASVSRRNRKTQHLPDAVTENPEMQCSASRTHAVRTGQTHLPVKFHGENTPTLPVTRKGKSGRLLRRPQRGHPAAPVAEFVTAGLKPVLTFPANPWKLWETGNITLRRMALKLAFSDRIAYCRNKGARTVKIALPFKALGSMKDPQVCFGAPTRTRTADLLITNQLLYQLSYRGIH